MSEELPVLAGVDGSVPSAIAVELAAREARLRGRPLKLVHAFAWPLLGRYLGPSPEGPPDAGLAADAERLVEDAVAQARAAAPQLSVSGEVITGTVVPVLLAAAKSASLVVLGSRGLGGFTGLLVGSVTVQVAAHATIPVLVAQGTPRSEGPVVVGVDGSPASATALEFAVAEAAIRGAELVALHAWSGRLSEQTEDALPLIYDAGDVEAELAREVRDWVAPARAAYPQVTVREEVRHGRSAHTLVEASAAAQLVVVGARGRGGFTGLLLGSVSQAVLHHAGCPVAIIRHPA